MPRRHLGGSSCCLPPTFSPDTTQVTGPSWGRVHSWRSRCRTYSAVSGLKRDNFESEVDDYWDKLLDGGKAMQCGWVTDRFGVSRQIVPAALMQLLRDKDAAGSQRVMTAMMKMVKLDIAALQEAAAH
jgi:hypothetical protein